MSRAIRNTNGSAQLNKISNVTITITDNAAVLPEGETVIATCNNKTFSSVIVKGKCKIYSTEVGTYTITAGEYSTMLVCPYYGQFSTDIYSGVLEVVCTEENGNGKLCHVRSCNGDYEFTEMYDLAQTFDGNLRLIFLGIPVGKYLITVDDKYQFFKEITSIQNTNSIEVDLKQWLYKDGDECIHNTGGWMQCYVANNSVQAYSVLGDKYGGYSVSQSAEFLFNSIHIIHNSSAYSSKAPGNPTWHGISRINCSLFVGTKKHNSIDLAKYSTLVTNSNSNLFLTLRSGTLNTSQTTETTAIVIANTNGKSLNLSATVGTSSSLVMGVKIYHPGYGWDVNGNKLDYAPNNDVKSYSDNIDISISQIYLI